MSSNYDFEVIPTPPWWPGVLALAALVACLLGWIFSLS